MDHHHHHHHHRDDATAIKRWSWVSILSILAVTFLGAFQSGATIISHSDGGNDLAHPCIRPCTDNGKPMDCHYKFKVEVYQVLSMACFNCPVNVSHCYLPDCVAADGMDKSIIVANRKLPGPSIQVCKGDKIIVDVENAADPQTTSIHWHGILQKGSQDMDGVPMVTQWPIQPFTSYRYAFRPIEAGTFWWHSHSSLQLGDGLFGSLIVRQAADRDTYHALYEYDLPEHVVIAQDWYNKSTVDQFVRMEFYALNPEVQSMLVNGHGRRRRIVSPADGHEYQTPLTEFRVESGKRYRFRLIGTGVECGIQVSIDGHRLLVIATDSRPVVPVAVDALNVYSGERYDFVLNANNTVANYWMKFRGLDTCNRGTMKTYQMAILRYAGASTDEDPPGTPSYDYARAKGIILNPSSSDNKTLFGTVDTFLTSALPDDVSVLRQPDVRLTLRYDYRDINDTIYNKAIYYHDMAEDLFHIKTTFPMINYIFNQMPPFPLLTHYDNVPQEMLCNEQSLKRQGRNCTVDFCKCTHVVELPLNKIIQILLVDDGVYDSENGDHPIHLHGHSFRVVAIGRLPPESTATVEAAAEEVARLERLAGQNRIAQKLNGAVYKDTLNVPNGGYAVIQFYTDNPGFWFLHCHIEHHIPLGMGVIFQVGKRTQFSHLNGNNYPFP